VIASVIVTESDSGLVIGFVIASETVIESDSGFVTDFVITSVIVTTFVGVVGRQVMSIVAPSVSLTPLCHSAVLLFVLEPPLLSDKIITKLLPESQSPRLVISVIISFRLGVLVSVLFSAKLHGGMLSQTTVLKVGLLTILLDTSNGFVVNVFALATSSPVISMSGDPPS